MTNRNEYAGRHRPETASGASLDTVAAMVGGHGRADLSRTAGEIQRDAWAAQAEGTRQDVEAARVLRSLRRRGARS